MTDLYFLRHGIADWDDWKSTGQSDDLRPLTEQGIIAMQRQAIALKLLQPSFTAILTSPLTRAQQTASIIHEQFPDLPLLEEALLKPGFRLKTLDKVRERHTEFKNLLLVGHEPDFSDVIEHLIGGGRVVMKKGGLAYVRIIKENKGELMWLLTPQVLGSDSGSSASS